MIRTSSSRPRAARRSARSSRCIVTAHWSGPADLEEDDARGVAEAEVGAKRIAPVHRARAGRAVDVVLAARPDDPRSNPGSDAEAIVPDTLELADALATQADFARTIPDTVAVADAQTLARDIAQAILAFESVADTRFAAPAAVAGRRTILVSLT